MTSNYDSEIQAADRCIAQYARIAAGKETVAHALLLGAAEDRAKADYWAGERLRFLALAGVTNVVQLPLPPVGETIA